MEDWTCLGQHKSNPGAGGKAGKEKDNHAHDDRGRPDRRQSLFADKVAHDDGVDHVVQQLEDIAQHQRERKEDQLPQNGPLGHVTCC